MADLLATLQSALGDAYRIERELPAGGMSRLVVATDTSAFGRLVVVKVLPPEMVSPQSTARFKREVDVTAHLQHPHVLPVLGAGVREGLLYYIMPYVEGESLRGRLERGDRYPLAGALRLLREVADALAYANGRGVVHRDIKPENILLADGHALVADFGIARGAMSPLEGTLGTATGVSLGTLGYMAPEQLFPSGPVDARVDIYSLGVVAYEVLAGVPPFLATTATALAAAHLNEVPRPLKDVVPTIPAEVSDAVAKALSKDPNDRQQSAAELRDAFESALSILQTGSVLRVAPSPPARRVGRLVLGGALVAVVGVAAAVFFRSESAPDVDPNRVLVAPFNLPEAVDFTSWDGADLWSQTLLNVATRNLDGMGPLTTVDAATVGREWKGRTDAVNTRAHARDYSAGLAVYGDIVKGDGDTLIARAQLLDVASGKTIDSVSVRGPVGRPDQLAAALALGLVDALRGVRQITATPNAGLGSRSPPAVKEFSKGEGFYRNTQWDSALVHYERAFAIDSTFALAYRRAGRSLAWLRSSDDSLSRDYLQRAGALNRNLSPHDSLLLTADSLSATLPSLYGDPSWLPKVRRLFDVLNTAVRLYPSDPEVWYSRGDASYHYGYGPGVGIGDRQELSDFSRAIELNAAFAPAYEHAVELAFSLNLPDTARTYAALYLALNPQREDASTIRIVKQIADYAASQSAAFDVYIDSVDAHLLASAWLTLRRWADAQETAVQVARVLVNRQHVDGVFPDPRLRLSLELAYRGHAEEAGALLLQLGDFRNSMVVDYALIGAFPIAKADSMFRFWLDDYATRGSGPFPWWTLPWWNKQRDTAMIERIVTIARRVSPDTSDAQRRFGAYVSQSARGYLELAKGDSSAALRTLRTLPDSLCVGCYQDRLETARLLALAGELERAALLLDERPNRLLTPTEIPLAFERARVADALQKRSKARDAYSLVANAWSAADTFLRSIVAEATTGAAPRASSARPEGGTR